MRSSLRRLWIIVVAILCFLFLISLLLPSVQSRGCSPAANASTNMHNIVLALLNYEAKLPQVSRRRTSPTRTAGRCTVGALLILPFLEMMICTNSTTSTSRGTGQTTESCSPCVPSRIRLSCRQGHPDGLVKSNELCRCRRSDAAWQGRNRESFPRFRRSPLQSCWWKLPMPASPGRSRGIFPSVRSALPVQGRLYVTPSSRHGDSNDFFSSQHHSSGISVAFADGHLQFFPPGGS